MSDSSLPPIKTQSPTETAMEGKSIQNQTLEHPSPNQNNIISPLTSNPEVQEWEAKVRVWLSALPDQSNLTMIQVESWINSNQVPLPEELQSLSHPQLFEKILSLNKHTPQSEQAKASGSHPARFQRTDQWIPVYAWLESLNKNEVVKSKEITDWLSENPDVKEKLYSRHSRYHLMHYVQKCHMKILKRQGKLPKTSGSPAVKKFEPQAVKPISSKAPMQFLNNGVSTVAVPPYLGTPSSNLVKDKDVSLIKRNDDFRRYQLFTELENQLSSLLSKQDK